MKKDTKKNRHILDVVKSVRKQSRQEEIDLHGKPLNYTKIVKSKKTYNRKKDKHVDVD